MASTIVSALGIVFDVLMVLMVLMVRLLQHSETGTIHYFIAPAAMHPCSGCHNFCQRNREMLTAKASG